MIKISSINPDERQSLAEQYFLQGYNCAQSVLLCFSDILEVDKDTLLTISSGLGGGMARMREVCGTVSAMAILAGFISPARVPADMQQRTANYALVQQFADSFRQIRGSIICRELLGLKKEGIESPSPSARTPEYYKSRPCAALVGTAARIVAEYLKEHNQ